MRVCTGGEIKSLLVSMNKNPQCINNALWIKGITRMLSFPVSEIVNNLIKLLLFNCLSMFW